MIDSNAIIDRLHVLVSAITADAQSLYDDPNGALNAEQREAVQFLQNGARGLAALAEILILPESGVFDGDKARVSAARHEALRPVTTVANSTWLLLEDDIWPLTDDHKATLQRIDDHVGQLRQLIYDFFEPFS